MAVQISSQALSGLRCRQPAAVASRTQNRVLCRCELQRRHDSSIMQPEGMAQHAGQRVALAAAACALAALLAAPGAMAAEEAADIVPVYFGNGCFWGRQFDYVQAEKALGRDPVSMSAVAGYAGGAVAPKAGKVCYYRGPSGSVYEELGHAEVVQVDLRGDSEAAKQQYAKFAETYFKQFRKTPFGMLRLDPQDAGPGYRNVIGLPGGIQSPLFEVLQAANVNGMRLLPGDGNTFSADGRPAEDDVINTVWVLDSDKLAFNRAEQYHQFHNGIGRPFPKTYTKELKQQMVQQGKIDETGCPEYYFF